METAEEVEAHPWTEEDPSKSTGQLPGLPGSKVPTFNRPKHGRSLLDLLQGKWHRKEDGQPVGDWAMFQRDVALWLSYPRTSSDMCKNEVIIR